MPAKKLMFNAKQIWDISENTQRDCRGGIAENIRKFNGLKNQLVKI